MTKLMIGEISS